MEHLHTITLPAFFVLLFIIARRLITVFRPSSSNTRKRFITNEHEIYELLCPPHNPSAQALLKPRAISNARLVSAFGIDNAFTTVDPAVHSRFRAKVLHHIRSIEKDYGRISSLACDAARRQIAFSVKTGGLGLAHFWRCLTMEVVLSIFFPDAFSPELASEEDLNFITLAINDIWNASKEGMVQPALANELQAVLAKLTIQDQGGKPDPPNPQDNPLNLILPAYETLWRVALQTHVNISTSDVLSEKFRSFAHNPSTAVFKDDTDGPSVQSAIAETLRLTPPTKRIYRSLPIPEFDRLINFIQWVFLGTQAPKHMTLGVDVEAVQTNCNVWGEGSHNWSPSRQANITAEQKRASVAFGVGRIKCVAENVAPRMAGILVGRAVDELEGWRIQEGGEIGGRSDWAGWRLCRST